MNLDTLPQPARRIADGLRRRIAIARDPAWAAIPTDAAILSITFDDFPASAAEAGARVLEAAGVRATYFLNGGTIGAQTAVGLLADADQIRRVAADGHEIGCHTFGHLNLGSISAAVLAADLDRNAAAFEDLGLPPAQTFAYPYGEIAPPAAKRLLAQRFDLARGIHRRIVTTRVDRAAAPAFALDVSSGGLDLVTPVIDQIARTGGWLTLYLHDIGPEPTAWGATEAMLAGALDAARAGGLEILPYRAAFTRASGGTRTAEAAA